MNVVVETCGHVADLIVMAHAFAELRDGVVARQHEERFQMWAQFRSNPLLYFRFVITLTRVYGFPTADTPPRARRDGALHRENRNAFCKLAEPLHVKRKV